MWYKALKGIGKREKFCEIVELSDDNYEKSFYCAIKPGKFHELFF